MLGKYNYYVSYNKYCDCNYVAVGKTHEKQVHKYIPKEWGIFIVSMEDGEIQIREKREAQKKPKMKMEYQITMLWRPEIQNILEKNHLPGYKKKSKKFVQQKIIEKVEWKQLKLQICEEMFERDYTLWNEEMDKYRNG